MAKSPFTTVAPMEAWARSAVPMYNGIVETEEPLAIETVDPRIALYASLFDEASARDERRQRLSLIAHQLTIG